MNEINIALHIKELNIFDDPEYCTSEREEMPNNDGMKCSKLGDYDKEGWCYAFDTWVDGEKPLRKCEQCKTAYLKSKGIEMTGCVLELGEYDNPVECVIDDQDCTQLDCIYSINGETKESCGFWKTVFVKQI